MSLLLAALFLVLPLASARAETSAAAVVQRDIDGPERSIAAFIAPVDEHARGARQIRTRTSSTSASAEAAPRSPTHVTPGGRVIAPTVRPARTRGTPLEFGCRAASRGEHVPYFPTPPPVRG